MTKKDTTAIAKALKGSCLGVSGDHRGISLGRKRLQGEGQDVRVHAADVSEVSFSVKLPKSRAKALALTGSEPTHYGLGAKGWVNLRPTTQTSTKLLFSFIDESYRAVAPKRVLANLDRPG